MADVVDSAQEINDLRLQDALARQARQKAPPHSGSCLYCEEPVPAPRRYCDSFCRIDHEKQMRRNRPA